MSKFGLNFLLDNLYLQFDLINCPKSLEYHIISKAHNSKSKSHRLVFVITPVSKENGTFYWRKQCSYKSTIVFISIPE